MEKRKRCQNFSIEERCRLVELVRSYKDAIINKKTDGASNEAKSSAWVFITSEFNSTATILRSKDSLQKAWVKLKSEGRSHYAKITGIPLSAQVTSDVLLEQVSAILHESTRALTDCNITSDDILDRVSAILDSANRTSGVTDSYDSSMEMMPLNVKEESTSSNDPLIPEVEVFIQEVDTAETEALKNEEVIKSIWSRQRSKELPENKTIIADVKDTEHGAPKKTRKGTENLKRKLLQEEMAFKRKLYKFQLESAEKEVEIRKKELEIRHEVLRQMKGTDIVPIISNILGSSHY